MDGVNAGVSGTPTLFINGRLLRNRSMEGFKEIIGKELGKAQKKGKP
jgi:protein-disulfide isomerase